MMQPMDHTSTIKGSTTRRGIGNRNCTRLPYYKLCSRGGWVNHSFQIAMSHLYASIISGALYQRVATYSVIFVGLSSGAELNPLLRPKSQTFSSQSAFTNKLPGFKSRWTTDAEWMYFMPAIFAVISLERRRTEKILRTTENLIYEILNMFRSKRLPRLDYLMQIRYNRRTLNGVACQTAIKIYQPSIG